MGLIFTTDFHGNFTDTKNHKSAMLSAWCNSMVNDFNNNLICIFIYEKNM